MSDLFNASGLQIIATTAVGVLVWSLRIVVVRFLDRLDKLEQRAAQCQLDNSRQFATKEDTSRLWERVDEHSTKIARLEATR